MAKRRQTGGDPVSALGCFLIAHGFVSPLVACSGGPDSLALLLATAEAARAAGSLAQVSVVHVDHKVRPGGAREAAVVRAAARAAGVAARRVRAVKLAKGVAARARSAGRSLEEVLREARYAALGRAATALGADVILTGHSATDQVETVLLHLLRGTGTRGLGGMRELTTLPGVAVPVGRPLLGCSRAELVELVRARGLEPVEDPSNADPRHLRNRVRQVVLPALLAVQPALEVVFGRAAHNLRDDAEALDALAAAVALTPEALLGAPRALRFRALAAAARTAGVHLESVHLPAIERLLAAARERSSLDLPGGRIVRVGQRISFEPPAPRTRRQTLVKPRNPRARR